MRYNLSSNQAHRIAFDEMIGRVLDDANRSAEAAGADELGPWQNWIDLDDLDVDDREEAAARIAAIWPAE